MARLRLRHTVLPIAAGFAIYHVGRRLEMAGDLSAMMGRRADALPNHLAALLLILGAFGCFIFAAYKLYRRLRGDDGPAAPKPMPDPPRHSPLAAEDAAPAFDPDAIIARYLAERNAPPASSPPAVPPMRGGNRGFGRKTT